MQSKDDVTTRSAAANRVADDLGLGPAHAAWLDELDGYQDAPDALPTLHEVEEALVRAQVGEDDSAAVADSWAELSRSESLRWLLDRNVALLAAKLGDVTGPSVVLPQLPAGVGAVGRCFPAHVFS